MSLQTVLAERNENPEDWRYTDWRALAANTFLPPEAKALDASALPQALAQHRIVFVAGGFRPDLSTTDALPEGLLSACDDGTCELRAEKTHCLALAPIEVLFFWPEADRPTQMETRFRITLGEHARVTLIERHIAQASAAETFAHCDTQITLAESAKLIHGKIVLSDAKNIHYTRTNVTASKGAFYDRMGLIHGGKSVRCETNVDLDGELGEARLQAVKLLDGDTQADTLLRVRHNAPHGISRQWVKTVLSDKAKGAFEGAIHVAPHAQRTDAHQLGRALVLSPSAEMNAKPELEIYADDVKCSHGSTIGDLDEAALFYLRSRGIDEKDARALLIRAFVDEIVDQAPAPEIAAILRAEMERVYG